MFPIFCSRPSSGSIFRSECSKIKTHKEVAKQYKSRYFLLFLVFLLDDGSGSRFVSAQIMTDPDGQKTTGSYRSGSGSTTLHITQSNEITRVPLQKRKLYNIPKIPQKVR
jgi:hypothetical protein